MKNKYLFSSNSNDFLNFYSAVSYLMLKEKAIRVIV